MTVLLPMVDSNIFKLDKWGSNIFKLDTWKITFARIWRIQTEELYYKKEDKGMICYNKKS